jgi:hypothetical protein
MYICRYVDITQVYNVSHLQKGIYIYKEDKWIILVAKLHVWKVLILVSYMDRSLVTMGGPHDMLT